MPEENLIDDNILWPEKGDTLFADAEDWQYNACLDKFGGDWYAYIEGYRLAADTIVEHVTQRCRRGVDLLVYPIVFLYRHHLELRLKSLIMDGKQLYNDLPEFPKTHKIDILWKECREILEKVWPNGPKEELDAVEACITEFNTIDPKSEAFRYPVNRQEAPILPSELKTINIRHLADSMAKVANLLDGAHCGISEYLDIKRDEEIEYWKVMSDIMDGYW
ncbi:MAG: hypothetical protein ABFD54_09590 [Armatimonadota bacterium]|nr:hypothetical protein [bacterium]